MALSPKIRAGRCAELQKSGRVEDAKRELQGQPALGAPEARFATAEPLADLDREARLLMRGSQPRQLAHLVLDGEHGAPLGRQRLEPLRRLLESRERGRVLAPRRPPGERLDGDNMSVL